MKIRSFIIFMLISFCFSFSLYAKVNEKILIQLEVTDQEYKDLCAAKIKFAIRPEDGKAFAVVTKPEYELLLERKYKITKIKKSKKELDLYKFAIYGESMKLDEAYYTYDEILTELDQLIEQYPELILKKKIGKTSQGKKDIWAVKISKNVKQELDKPSILFSGAIHSDELVGVQICMKLINQLLSKYLSDKNIKEWVEQYNIWFVPVINVDGHFVVTNNIDPRWRTNTRDVNNNGILYEEADGIDLNRNFSYNWAFGGSGQPGNSRYRGEYPFSESECVAIRDLALQEKFLLSITYHSAGEVIFYPWDWKGHKAPDDKLLTIMANELASNIKTIKEDTTYIPYYGAGTVGQTYPWLYGEVGTFDFIIELGLSRHIFPVKILNNIVENNLPAAYYILDKMKGPGLTGHVVDSQTKQPLEADILFPDIDNKSIKIRKSNKSFGRFYRLLLPGQYRVIISKSGYKTKLFKNIEILTKGWKSLEVELESE